MAKKKSVFAKRQRKAIVLGAAIAAAKGAVGSAAGLAAKAVASKAGMAGLGLLLNPPYPSWLVAARAKYHSWLEGVGGKAKRYAVTLYQGKTELPGAEFSSRKLAEMFMADKQAAGLGTALWMMTETPQGLMRVQYPSLLNTHHFSALVSPPKEVAMATANPTSRSARKNPAQVDQIIAYEQGELSGPEVIRLFASLIKTGTVWELQGSYGRMAKQLIEAGYISTKGRVLRQVTSNGMSDAERRSKLQEMARLMPKSMRESLVEPIKAKFREKLAAMRASRVKKNPLLMVVPNPRRSSLDVYVEKHPVSGALIVSAIVDGHVVRRTYMGYSKRAAVAMFRKEIKTSPRSNPGREAEARAILGAKGLLSKGCRIEVTDEGDVFVHHRGSAYPVHYRNLLAKAVAANPRRVRKNTGSWHADGGFADALLSHVGSVSRKGSDYANWMALDGDSVRWLIKEAKIAKGASDAAGLLLDALKASRSRLSTFEAEWSEVLLSGWRGITAYKIGEILNEARYELSKSSRWKKNPGPAYHKREAKRYSKLLAGDLKAKHREAADYWQGALSAEAAAVAVGKVVANPKGDDMGSITNSPEFKKAVKLYKKFHGCEPKSYKRVLLPTGSKNKVDSRGVFVSLGKAPAESYTPPGHSRKAGSIYVHKYEGRTPPEKVVSADGKLIVTLPGRHRVTDWIRG